MRDERENEKSSGVHAPTQENPARMQAVEGEKYNFHDCPRVGIEK
jgi:hypothetical protein